MTSEHPDNKTTVPSFPDQAALRSRTIGVAIALMGLGVVVSASVSPLVGCGIVLGSAAGSVGFWLMISSVGRLPIVGKEQAAASLYRGMYRRIFVYGITLLGAYFLDRVHLQAFAGAVGGLLVARYVLLLAGMRGMWALRQLRNRKNQGPINS